MPPPPQKRPPGVRGHQRPPALPAAQPGRSPAAPKGPSGKVRRLIVDETQRPVSSTTSDETAQFR
eukprot:5195939-Prymnesium_polylepis.1